MVIGLELAPACPAGGWLGVDCGATRDLVLAVIGLGAILYVGLLSAVVMWAARLRRRPGADPAAGQEWYAVAAVVGVIIAPLLAFSILAGLGWLG